MYKENKSERAPLSRTHHHCITSVSPKTSKV